MCQCWAEAPGTGKDWGIGVVWGTSQHGCCWRITASMSRTHIQQQHIWDMRITAFWLKQVFIIALYAYISARSSYIKYLTLSLLIAMSFLFHPNEKLVAADLRGPRGTCSSYIYLWTTLCPDLASGSAGVDFCACRLNQWSFTEAQRATPVNGDRK